jgi:periodic tryptophan protein 2
MDPFEIYVWSLQTGRLLDVLPGHEGPISAIAFNPVRSVLASCGWDKSVHMWDVFEGHKNNSEKWNTQSECLALAFRPDGRELCVACLDGQLYFFDVENGTLKFTIEGRKDVQGGRRLDDARAATNSTHNTAFTSLCYSADGACVLAGGNSKFVCIYEVSQRQLLKKFVLSHNQSFDGLADKLNSKRDGAAGNTDLFDLEEEEQDEQDRRDHTNTLPGVSKGEFSERKAHPVMRTKCVRFAPNGQSWAAASTEGLLIYSLDDPLTFDPFDLDMEITPDTIQLTIASEKNFSKALVMALRLSEKDIIRGVLEQTPVSEIPLVVRSLPSHHVDSVLMLLSSALESSPHIEFFLKWTETLLQLHGPQLLRSYNEHLTAFRALQKALTRQHSDLSKLAHQNQYQLDYFSVALQRSALQAESAVEADAAPAWAASTGDEKPVFDDDEMTEVVSQAAAVPAATSQPATKKVKSTKQ